MAACDCTLVHACLRMPKDISVSVSSEVYTHATERHEISAHHRVLWWCLASEVLSFLTCSSLIKAPAILSWLPLITDTAWALPGLLCFFTPPIPLEDYSRVPPASPCVVIKHEPYWQGEHQTLFFFFFCVFTHRQKEGKNKIPKLLLPWY